MKPSFFFRAGSVILAVTFLCGSAGCGKKNAALSGTVSYDGQLVDNGVIAFLPDGDPNAVDAQSKKVAERIKDGKYSIPPEKALVPGKYRVEITWNKKTGKKIGVNRDSWRDETEQQLPEKYNTESTLSREIKASDTSLDFNLEK
jgi:hypothetical protein